MKFFNWLFSRKKMPRSRAATEELFEATGAAEVEEWKAIEQCFANNEVPPPELIVAAFQLFIASKDKYVSELTQEAYALREEIVETATAIVPESEYE